MGGAAIAASALVGCRVAEPPSPAVPTELDTPDTRSWRTRPIPEPDLPPLADREYVLPAGEVEPACKLAAVAFVSTVLAARTVATTGVPLETRLAAIGQSMAPAAPLLAAVPAVGSAMLEVVYPQYGGLTPGLDQASVMFVADHLVQPETGFTSTVERRSMTIDVRLARVGAAWIVTEVLPAVLPPAAAAVSPTATAVLANPRLVLPAAARADIAGGVVNEAVLGALQALSQRWLIHVQVLSSGHPANIFATGILSNHTKGKAVDIWALDGLPVIDHARTPSRDLMLAGLDLGATEVGGPHALGRSGTFTNPTHQDHVHLGFPRAV